ncbi:MAG: DUF4296 domain-containing protein [Alistipes sp.]|jgi:hypothetical protein|nr:DUF4296 domain-containing protein [Alistipes sp.]
MRRLNGILVWVATLFVVAVVSACSKPKIISDGDLARMFHDVYLTNAYAETTRDPLDSLNIYEPLFARYGYTTEDVQYTIGNFAKRKSARLSDVVEEAIAMIEAESDFYSARIAMADTLRKIAGEKYATVVYDDSLILVGRVADTARLRIEIPDVSPGRYEIEYSYLVDSSDHNNLRASRFFFRDGTGRERSQETRRHRNFERERVTVSLAADSLSRLLVLNLNGYPREDVTDPRMRIDSLVVRYFIPDRVALDSMARGWFDYRVLDSLSGPRARHVAVPFADTLSSHAPNLVPPSADTAGAASR